MAGIYHTEPKLSIININDFNKIYNKIIGSNLYERENMDNLPKQRAKLVVPALVLMNYIIRKVNTQDIIVCPYALKEGIAIELIEQN
jgi:exopolyphosphatase/pppGpp-phosphohydrolase